MNNSDKEIDALIQEALTKEEADYFDQLGEQNIPQQLFGLFRGKNSWMNIVMAIVTLGVFALSVFTFLNMLNAEVLDEKLDWMFYTLICFMAMVLFKIWGWNQMDKNVLMREIKRLEYQVSLMKKK